MLQEWLSAKCLPNYELQAVLAKATSQPQTCSRQAGVEQEVYIGGKFKADPSHDLGVFRGLFYCSKCGAYGGLRPRRLRLPCKPPDARLQQTKKPHWRYAIDRIRSGLLPSGLLQWPDGQSSTATEPTTETSAASGANYGDKGHPDLVIVI